MTLVDRCLRDYSFGPGRFNYQAFACYDLLDGGNQKLGEYGVWTGDTYGLDAKGLGMVRELPEIWHRSWLTAPDSAHQTNLNLSRNLIGVSIQSGALFSFLGKPTEVNIRVGVSFRSIEQACQNAEEEVGTASFEEIQNQSVALWNEKLSKVEIDVANTPANVTEMLYSSLYRSFLTPVRILWSSWIVLLY
jgi:putative alpha-1,2-mannosidase